MKKDSNGPGKKRALAFQIQINLAQASVDSAVTFYILSIFEAQKKHKKEKGKGSLLVTI